MKKKNRAPNTSLQSIMNEQKAVTCNYQQNFFEKEYKVEKAWELGSNH